MVVGNPLGHHGTDDLMEIAVRLALGRRRHHADFCQQFAQTRLRPGRSGRIAQFEDALREGTQTIQHAGHLPLRAVDARTWCTRVVTVRLRWASLLITRIAHLLLITWFATLRLIAWLTTLLLIAWLLLIARFATLLLITWWARFATLLLITRWARFATLLLITWRLFGAHGTLGRNWCSLNRSDVACSVGGVLAFITFIITFARFLAMISILAVRNGIAVRVTTTTAATTTTTTTTRSTWFTRFAFAMRRIASSTCGRTIVSRQIGNRGGIEHFRFGGRMIRRGGDQFTRGNFFRFISDRRSDGDGRRYDHRTFSGSRGAGNGQASGQHSLQSLDEIIFSEPATVLDLMFTRELSEVFDAECGEIRLIRHGSNSPAQTLRVAAEWAG